MILTTHALTGAVIGKYIDNPAIIIATSLGIHFMMDTLRHGEYFNSRTATIKNTWWKIAIDLTVGLSAIFLFILVKHPGVRLIQNIFIASFTSLLPDGLTLIYWKYPKIKILAIIKDFHGWAHCYGRSPRFSPERQWTWRNAVNDIVISAVALFSLIFF
jgi:hypothetical protein